MKLRNGNEIHSRVKESGGNNGFVFWLETSYFPVVYFVRGDSFDDAYNWFVSNEEIEEQIEIEEEYCGDYIDGFDSRNNKATIAGLIEAWKNGKASGVEINCNGKVITTELINGSELETYSRSI